MLAGVTQVQLFIILGKSFMEILSEINLLKNVGDIKSCWCVFGTDKNDKISCSLTEFEGKLYPACSTWWAAVHPYNGACALSYLSLTLK